MRPELTISEMTIRTPSLFSAIDSPVRSRSLSAGPSSSSLPLLTPPDTPPTPRAPSPQPKPKKMVDAAAGEDMDTIMYVRPRRPAVETFDGPTPGRRSVGVQAALDPPQPAPPVEHKVVIEIRHVMPPAATPTPPAPEPPEVPAATWYGRAWQKTRKPLLWIGWGLMQLLAVINIPLVLNFRPRA